MCYKTLTSSLAVFTCIASLPSQAEELNISPGILSGITYINYEQEAGFFSGITFSEFNVAGFAPLVGGSLHVDYGPVFLSVLGQKTFEANDSDSLTVIVPRFGQTFGQTVDLDSTFRRSDITALIGYDIESEPLLGRTILRLFAGYKYATANIENAVSGKSNVPPFLPTALVTGDLNVDFTYHGPNIGLTYVIPIDLLKGDLALTSAFTYYMAEIDQQFQPSGGRGFIGRWEGTSDADSIGYFFGIAWNARLIDSFYYTLEFDVSKSDFDTDGNASDFSETEYRFRAGVTYNINTDALFGARR